jgi:hypothetical protein
LNADSRDERPGAAERAKALLAEPFDDAAAQATARSLLIGERSPGPGQSLVSEA